MGAAVRVEDMPSIVREIYDFVLKETGVPPIVERSGYGRMLFTHSNDRVRVTVAFRLNGRTWHWSDSKLFIDGKRVPNASSQAMYISIFKDPDGGRSNHIPKGAKKADLPESEPVEAGDLPPTVVTVFDNLRKAATDDGVDITPMRSTDGSRYLIEIKHLKKNSTIILFFELAKSAPGWLLSDTLAVNALGYDITRYLDRDLNEHLVDLLGAESRARQTPLITQGRVEGAAVTNSTMVRKATVVRV